MDNYIEKCSKPDRQIAQGIGKAIGDWPHPDDEESFMRTVEALRSLCKLHYREAHFNLVKAAQKIMEDHAK